LSAARSEFPRRRSGTALPFLLRQASRKPVLACADQAVASATSFLTLVMVAHATDIAQVGAFALGISVLGVALAVQHSLISLPYAIQRHRPAEETAEHAFSCLLLSGALAAGCMVLLGATALLLSLTGVGGAVATTLWLLAAAVPFVLVREFARDFDIARVNFGRALALDTGSGLLQLCLIGAIAAFGSLSPNTAYAAIAISNGVALVAWMLKARADFSVRFVRLRDNARQSWHVGKWLFLSRAALLIQGYSTYWISMLVAGPAVTGIYAACMSVVSFANPVMLGIYNLLVPRSVLTWKEQGGAALYRQSIRDALLLGGLMAAFFLGVLIGGETILNLLYPDGMVSGHGAIVSILAFSVLISAVGIPASNALASMERPRATAAIAGAAAVLNVVLVFALMTVGGLLGAAVAITIANLFSSVGRWIALSVLLPRRGLSPSVGAGYSSAGPRVAASLS
jgi:O-antigen/teichoic acid export membrane protein